jgi:hypothetical protein
MNSANRFKHEKKTPSIKSTNQCHLIKPASEISQNPLAFSRHQDRPSKVSRRSI